MPKLDTLLIHAGQQNIHGAVVNPIFQSATYALTGEVAYGALRYLRLNNTPNQTALAEKLAAIEGTGAALVTASGMAAITAALLSNLSVGQHALVQSTVYGGTATFLTSDAPRMGIACDFVDVSAPETWAAALRPETTVFYVESIANPLLSVGRLRAVVAFARQHGLVTIVDNTFPSPVNFQPASIGFDLIVHSATKYLNGHSDIVAGVIAGAPERVEAARHLLNHLGGSLDPNSCFLLERGLKTLGLRVRQHNASAMALARALAAHPAIASVHYPGLPGSPGHEIAAELFSGFGGMIAFTLKDPALGDRLIERLTLPVHAPSLGGVESLIVRPATSTHLGMTPQERAAAGISDGLIRVSVGLEDTGDLLADFAQALA
ncbi:MAG: PLP-dependent transferase [Myxococcota bacterium]|nr:PLP-dependent transferase [Myxococcota bacterium]